MLEIAAMNRYATLALPTLAVSALCFLSPAAFAQQQKNQVADTSAAGQLQQPASQIPSIEAFMKIRAPNSPTLAPDGTLYVRDWPDGVNQLYKREPGQPVDAPMTRLTNFTDGLSSYSLSPDGATIILAAASGGSEQDDLYMLDTATGQIVELMADPNVVFGFQLWLRDSSGFIYTANDTSRADFHIYRYDLSSRSSTKLLDRPGYWLASDITNDGSRLLVMQYISASHVDAYELNVATGELTSLNLADEAYNTPAGYLPGEQAVMVISDNNEQGFRRLFVRNLATGEVRKPLPELDGYDIEGSTLSEDRTIAAIIFNENGYATPLLVRLPSFDRMGDLNIDKGIVSSVDIRNGILTCSLSNARTPGLSYAIDLSATNGEAKQITVAQTQSIDLSAFTLPQLITYPSFDGLEIPAFLYTPPGYKPGKPIPFVAMYHGGPEAQFRPSFSPLTQYLLASGFGIIQPNVRGSTGYGREFHMLDNYKNRWDSVRDGVEAVRWLISNGYTEPGRVAAYGGSYGGFMASAVIIEGSDVFGASINVVGIVNFITFLEQTKDYRRKLREAEYGPLSDPEFLASISPLNRIDEIKCPMLIAHGLNDPRVPVGEAMQLAVGLQKRGYDPELLFFPDEGHGFAKLENRLLFAQRMVKFLQRTIGE